jgi:hypothetical protein
MTPLTIDKRTFHSIMSTHHLCNAKAVSEIVEWHVIVVVVDGEQECPQGGQVQPEGRGELKVEEHLLHQHQQLLVLPLAAVERHLTQSQPQLFRGGHLAKPRKSHK